MRRSIRSLALAAVLLLLGIPAHAQVATAPSLQLSFDADGRVNLAARNVTVREILAEWARQCGCYVINAERMPGGPLTTPIQFEHASQQAVLESLLRTAAGFALTPQRAGSRSVSNFETIYILATSSPVSNTYAPAAAAPVTMMPTPGAPDDELPPVVPAFNRADTPQGSAMPGAPAPAPPQAQPPTPTSRIGGVPSSFTPGTGAVPIVAVPAGQAPNTPAQPGTMPIPPQMPAPVPQAPAPGR